MFPVRVILVTYSSLIPTQFYWYVQVMLPAPWSSSDICPLCPAICPTICQQCPAICPTICPLCPAICPLCPAICQLRPAICPTICPLIYPGNAACTLASRPRAAVWIYDSNESGERDFQVKKSPNFS